MDPTIIGIGVAATLMAGVGLFFGLRQLADTVKEQPVRPEQMSEYSSRRTEACTPVSDLREGALVKVVGQIEYVGGEAPAKGPLTDTPCACFTVTAGYAHTVQSHGVFFPPTVTRLLLSHGSGGNFWLRAGTERVEIHIGDPLVLADKHGGTATTAARLFAEHSVDMSGDRMDTTLFHDECHVIAEEMICVVGKVVAVAAATAAQGTDATGGKSGARDAPTVLVIAAPDGTPGVIISTEPASLLEPGMKL